MTAPVPPAALRFRRAFLLLFVASISLLFLWMVREYVLAVFLAAIFAGLANPLYRRLRFLLRGRAALASALTILLLLFGVGIPLAAFLTLVATQAVEISQAVAEWLPSQTGRLALLRDRVETLPWVGELLPPTDELIAQAKALAAKAGPSLAGTLAAATRGTFAFFLQFFVLLYAMFYFLVDGGDLLARVRYYVPLGNEAEDELLERFTSVTRATLKGTLLIGVIQGALAGIAFAVTGVPGAALWGTVMVVASLIPAVGGALVWVPADLYLFATGRIGAGVGLFVWCALVVGSVDNVLRPRLVGRDARMSDLLILLSTMGGLALFGAMGFVVGPIVAALFVTVWHIYGREFGAWLPTPRGGAPADDAAAPGETTLTTPDTAAASATAAAHDRPAAATTAPTPAPPATPGGAGGA